MSNIVTILMQKLTENHAPSVYNSVFNWMETAY